MCACLPYRAAPRVSRIDVEVAVVAWCSVCSFVLGLLRGDVGVDEAVEEEA